MAQLDRMVRRILRSLFAVNALDDRSGTEPIYYAAHAATAERIAEPGIVLYKKDGELVPLVSDAASIAVVGSHGDLGVLSGMVLIGITTSADANIGNGYTLLSIAGVILGGGEFIGGIVSPVGAVIGALTLALAASPLLTFMQIPPDWQVGANGAILIIVWAARAQIGRKGAQA